MWRMSRALHFFFDPSHRRKVVEVGGLEGCSINIRKVRPVVGNA